MSRAEQQRTADWSSPPLAVRQQALATDTDTDTDTIDQQKQTYAQETPEQDQTQPQHRSAGSDASNKSDTNIMKDAEEWFERSNLDPTTTLDANAMDVDPPFLQKRDSSSDDLPLAHLRHGRAYAANTAFLPPGLLTEASRGSSADDFRSVIDDLTIENKRLKEELKRYKQNSNHDVLEREKLFEIKVHGLPRRKKQELEATLRDFAAGLGDSASSEATSKRRRELSQSSKDKHHQHYPHHHHHHHHHQHHQHHHSALYSSRGSRSKQESNSSSRSRPVDSAYASMSTGAHSSGASLVRPSFGGPRARTSEQKVERYLEDIPQGLHPNYGFRSLGDNEKKKLIVRRLEQLFTGKVSGRYARNKKNVAASSGTAIVATAAAGTTTRPVPPLPRDRVSTGPSAGTAGASSKSPGAVGSGASGASGASGVSGVSGDSDGVHVGTGPTPPRAIASTPQVDVSRTGPTREARILHHASFKKGDSHENLSASHSNSNGDEAGNGSGNTNGSGNGNGKSPPGAALPEQRPTRPLDLDPDRVQDPSANMEYIRHLGLVPPKIGPENSNTLADVSPDAEGWVYLNLLANLAQLHILNVSNDFIRQAVVEKSTKFQLSPDGRKIRWRGGMDGTKFSSDGGSGDSSQQSTSVEDGDGSEENGHRKRTKTSGKDSSSGLSSKKRSKSAKHESGASSSFHYKPLFAHRSSRKQTTEDETTSPNSDRLMPVDSPAGAVRSSPESAMMDGRGQSHSHSYDMRDRDRDRLSGSRNANADGEVDSDTNADADASQYETSRSRSSSSRARHQSDGVLVYYSGMPFCTDLAGDSGDTSPTTYMESARQAQEAMEDSMQGRPTMHRSSSGSFIPIRPLTDYLDLSKDESAALGLLDVGRSRRAKSLSSQNTTDNQSSSASYRSVTSVAESSWDDDILLLAGSDDSETDELEAAWPAEPFLEASGLSMVFPEDHFAVHVMTKRLFRPYCGVQGAEDDDGEDSDNFATDDTAGAFSMTSLKKRLAALKKPMMPPVAGATAQYLGWSRAAPTTPPVVIEQVSATIVRREPVPLPQPAMFYLLSSTNSSSDSESDLLVDTDGVDGDDDSGLASSSDEMISQRANPHHSENRPSPATQALSSGDDGDVEPMEETEEELRSTAMDDGTSSD